MTQSDSTVVIHIGGCCQDFAKQVQGDSKLQPAAEVFCTKQRVRIEKWATRLLPRCANDLELSVGNAKVLLSSRCEQMRGKYRRNRRKIRSACDGNIY